MPGPTAEVLNDDIKGLREDLHKMEVSLKDEIHTVKDEVRKVDHSLLVEIRKVDVALREEIRKVDVALREEIRKVDVALREEIRKVDVALREEIHKVDVAVAKLSAEFHFAKWLLGLTLSLTLTGIGGGIWWAATINANVRNLEITTNDRFDRLEATLGKILEQTKPASRP